MDNQISLRAFANESGAIVSETEMWGSYQNVPYYIFRPWTDADKGFEISNIINISIIMIKKS